MGLFTIIRILGKENTKVDRNTTNRETLNYATQEETMRSLAKGVARKLTKILKTWAWSPTHNRLDAYYLHRGRSEWSLWSKYWDDNSGRWNQIAVGSVSRRGVDQKQAAVYLLLKFWAYDSKESDLDEFHWINEDGYLSIAELAAIAREVW